MSNSLAEHVALEVPTTRTRAAIIAGPAALVSVAVGALTSQSADPLAAARSPLGITSSACALLAVVAIALTAMHLVGQRFLARGAGRVAALVAVVGSVLTSGGYWGSVFVQPSLAQVAPEGVIHGLPSITAGFVISYAVMGIGWGWLSVLLIRARVIGRAGWLLPTAGLICLSPLPFRFLPMAVAVTIALGMTRPRQSESTG
jgi:hypothetical protein